MIRGAWYFFMLEDGIEYQAVGLGDGICKVIARRIGSERTEEGTRGVWQDLAKEDQFLINLSTLEKIDSRKTN